MAKWVSAQSSLQAGHSHVNVAQEILEYKTWLRRDIGEWGRKSPNAPFTLAWTVSGTSTEMGFFIGYSD